MIFAKSGRILAALLVILVSSLAAGARDCAVLTAGDALLPRIRIQCPLDPGTPPQFWSEIQAHELDEVALEQTVQRSNNETTFMALLYHASWCPFSKQMRPLFRSLAALYPSVYHAEVEESTIRPGLLSKNGVYSFPVLYIYVGSTRHRYSGGRSVEDISKFYTNITGVQPLTRPSNVTPEPSPRLHQTDTYLTLASWFLVLRALLYVLPLAVTRVRNFWNRCHLYKMMLKPRGEAHHGDRGGNPHKRARFTPPGWSHQIPSPSSSLAIAESSTRRVTTTSEDILGR